MSLAQRATFLQGSLVVYLTTEGFIKDSLLMTIVANLQALRSDLLAALERVELLLELFAPKPATSEDDLVRFERTKAIERVLADRGRPMRPIEIWAELRRSGRDDPKMEVQVTTNDLWHRGRIDRLSRGLYSAKKP